MQSPAVMNLESGKPSFADLDLGGGGGGGERSNRIERKHSFRSIRSSGNDSEGGESSASNKVVAWWLIQALFNNRMGRKD